MITRDEIESLGWAYKDDEDYYAPRYELPGAIMFPPMRVHRAGAGYSHQPPHLIVMKSPDTLEGGESYYPDTAHDLILIMRENGISAANGPDIAAETARAATARRNEECQTNNTPPSA